METLKNLGRCLIISVQLLDKSCTKKDVHLFDFSVITTARNEAGSNLFILIQRLLCRNQRVASLHYVSLAMTGGGRILLELKKYKRLVDALLVSDISEV